MDYDLEPYVDNEEDLIKNINTKLDEIMDDLFFGKKLKFIDIEKDIKKIVDVKKDYYELINKYETILENDATLLSSSAGKAFGFSMISILSAYFVPLMAVPSIFAFARGMKYYTAYKILSNKDVMDEYLSFFDRITNRINNYVDVIKSKYDSYIEKNDNYLKLDNLFKGMNIIYDENTTNDLKNILKYELNTDIDDIFLLVDNALDYINEKNSLNKSLILSKNNQ